MEKAPEVFIAEVMKFRLREGGSRHATCTGAGTPTTITDCKVYGEVLFSSAIRSLLGLRGLQLNLMYSAKDSAATDRNRVELAVAGCETENPRNKTIRSDISVTQSPLFKNSDSVKYAENTTNESRVVALHGRIS